MSFVSHAACTRPGDSPRGDADRGRVRPAARGAQAEPGGGRDAGVQGLLRNRSSRNCACVHSLLLQGALLTVAPCYPIRCAAIWIRAFAPRKAGKSLRCRSLPWESLRRRSATTAARSGSSSGSSPDAHRGTPWHRFQCSSASLPSVKEHASLVTAQSE